MISRLRPAVLLAALFISHAAQAEQYQAYRLWSPSVNVLLNEQGQAAGGIWLDGRQRAVRLDADGTRTTLPVPGFFWDVKGLNESGTALVTYYDGKQGVGLLHEDGQRSLISLPANTAVASAGLNDSNVVVGGLSTGTGAHPVVRAFRWQDGAMSMLDSGGFARTGATDINNAGEIVGWIGGSEGDHAAVWRNGVPQMLASDGRSSMASFINDQGLIAGYAYTQAGLDAVVWDQGQMTILGGGWVRAVNNKGAVIWTDLGHYYLWRDGQSVDLETLLDKQKYPGYGIAELYDINDQGQITAMLLDPVTMDQFGVLLSPFAVTPVPEPQQFLMMLAGLLLLPRRQRRQAPGRQEGQQVPAEHQ